MSRLHGLAPAAIFAAALAWSHCAAAQDAPEATTLRPVDVNARPARPVRPRATPRPAPRQATARRPVSAPPTLTTAAPSTAGLNAAPSPLVQRYQLPQTTESRTAERVEQTTNIVDVPDAVKYLPSLFVRKRNYGDNQAVLATRTWGLNSSARTMIYVDDILISNYQGNNNSNASPRWGMVAPEEIQRIDFLYGPFAAMYPGNSIGGVLQITTRTPDKPEWTFKQTEAFQTFDFYKTSNTYRTDQSSASFGNRFGDLAVFVSGNFQNSNSQPLAWVTTSTPFAQLPQGAIPQLSRIGALVASQAAATANVLGAGGLLHTEMFNVKTKAALDITDWLKATYTVGLWSNDQKSRVDTYLRDANGPTYGGPVIGAGFASNYYNLNQVNLANAFSLKTNTRGNFDWDLVVTRYDYLTDIQRNPFTVAATGTNFIDTGKITRLDGTNWMTADARGIWRPTGPGGPHEVSFGIHGDRYELVNPIYKTPTWFGGPDATSTLYTDSLGKTQTTAVWVQDAWRLAPQLKLTTGGRWEDWRAFDGFNLNTTTASATGAITGTTIVNQPTLSAGRFSPKASLTYEASQEWQLTGSYGVANRFPTVTELYQITTLPGTTVPQNPNPNLRPERALSGELAIERRFADGAKVRLSLFQENTRDMIISQLNVLPNGTSATFVTNVDEVRNRGVELAWQKNNLPIDGMEVFGSVTYVDSIILSDPSFVGTPLVGGATSTAVGKHVPNVPEWRATFGATYRPTDALAITLVGRYQSKIYATLDNIDTVPNVFQAFDPFVVVDTRLQYKASDRGTVSVGIDNLFNEKYHLFHPFPQRTFVVEGKLKL